MRKLLTNFIGPNVAQPIKQGSLDHLQLAYEEALNALAQSQIGKDYDPSKVYVLYGCVNSDPAPNYDISAGAVFFNGEVYLVDATVFVAADTAVGTVAVSYFASAIADPVTFTDGVAHNVHEIKKMVITDAASGSGDADFEDWVRDEWIVSTSTAGVAVGGLSTGTITSLEVNYIKKNNIFYIAYSFIINVTVAGASVQVDYPLPITADADFLVNRVSNVYSNSGGDKSGVSVINGTTLTLLGLAPIVGANSFEGQLFYMV